jgi:queuine tRNA-ribosyltransferase
MIFTRNGIINIRNVKWKKDYSPLEEEGEVFTDREYSKAYLRHLFIAKEMLAPMIATAHNLGFYIWLMAESRKKILEGNFSAWKTFMTKQLMKRL